MAPPRAPGASISRAVRSRDIGRSSTIAGSIDVATCVRSRIERVIVVIVTDSPSSLGWRSASTRTVSPIRTSAFRVTVCVPVCANVIRYVPAGRSAAQYVPRVVVRVERVFCSTSASIVTLTAASGFPLEVTRPTMVDAPCANARVARSATINSRTAFMRGGFYSKSESRAQNRAVRFPIALAGLLLFAQDLRFHEKIEVRLIEVNAVVTDREGHRVYRLTADDF